MRTASRLLRGLAGFILLLTVLSPALAGSLDAPGYTKAFTCSACHGFAGNSRSDTVPILAGMAPWYLKKAIQDYASGRRPAPEMEPYAKMVIHLGLDEVAAYFAAQKREPTPAVLDPAAIARGRAASALCVACHGPEGRGDPARGVPELTGQPPGYLKHQMLLFKTGQRSSGDEALQAMKAFMRTIPDPSFADLAAYFSSVQ